MTQILLITVLAAGSDSLPSPSVVRDTVYIERVAMERSLNPEATPPTTIAVSKSSPWKRVLTGAFIAGGTYLILHGRSHPTYELRETPQGWEVRDEVTNPEVYIGLGFIGVGLLALSF